MSLAVALLISPAEALHTSARSAILLDGMTGRVLYQHNADEKSLIASTTKIMTGLLICEQCAPDARVEIRPECTGIEGSSMYLKSGEVLSVQDLLYGLMLRSGNDAAMALAVFCDGSAEAFAQRMNARAQQLGLTGTQYRNPHGLDDDGNYSTARDLAHLTAHALENPAFRSVVSTRSVTVGSRQLVNHNKLLWRYDGAIGVKTGYTKAAGRILVSAAERDGRRLIAVTISDPNDWDDHIRLLDYGFSAFTSTPIINAGDILLEVPVLSGSADGVCAAAPESFSYPLSPDEQAVIQLHLPPCVYAPVEAGDAAGEAVVLVDGQEAARLPLYWTDSVTSAKISKWDALWRRLGGYYARRTTAKNHIPLRHRLPPAGRGYD